MYTTKKLIITILALLILLSILSFSWAHPAFVRLVNGENCQKSLLKKAKKRLIAFYGESRSSPLFLCLSKPTLGLDISHGTAIFVPLLPSIIIIGPNGLNEDVIAHEYAHDELKDRTGSLLRTYHIPTWFDEGLAMQLDNRKDYSVNALREYLKLKNLNKPSLSKLEWSGNFFKKGNQGKLNYAFARCVVQKWLNSGQSHIPIINEISWTKSFPTEKFKPFEKKCLQLTPAGPV